MDLRDFVRSVVRSISRHIPRVIRRPLVIATHRLGVIQLRRIWEGQYSHVRDVPRRGPGWEDPAYLLDSADEVRRVLAHVDGRWADDVDENRAVLGLTASILRGERKGRLRVLDLGGGLGIGFGAILACVGDDPDLDYHIVELPLVCEEGRRLFSNDSRVHFHTSIPELMDVDIAWAVGVVELIEDWAGTLRALCARNPRYVLLTNVCCGFFETYASGFTLLRGSILPFWFLHADEIVTVMSDAGYALACRTLMGHAYNQDNFPSDLRLPGGHPSIFLFTRKDASRRERAETVPGS